MPAINNIVKVADAIATLLQTKRKTWTVTAHSWTGTENPDASILVEDGSGRIFKVIVEKVDDPISEKRRYDPPKRGTRSPW